MLSIIIIVVIIFIHRGIWITIYLQFYVPAEESDTKKLLHK